MSDTRKRIAVIGAGAAGCACAHSLAQHPDRFSVHLFEAAPNAGGVATSEVVVDDVWINDGVQGGTKAYRNTLLLLERHQQSVTDVHMKVSFGKGDNNWTNYFPTPLVERFSKEIARFGKVLERINSHEKLFMLIPIRTVLWWYGFSRDFGARMVYPLTALFFGTGNQTEHVSATIVAKVFLDEDLRLFDYDSKLLLSQTPDMFSFRSLRTVYESYVDRLRSDGATVLLSTTVTSVVRSKKGGVKVYSKRTEVADDNASSQGDANAEVDEEDQVQERQFDEVVFACPANVALAILGKQSSFMERRVLGAVKYYDDITVTHTDMEYMQKHYDIDLSRNDQYFIKTYEDKPQLAEMSFNLANYQAHLKDDLAKHGRPPYMFQSIFLNKDDGQRWTMDEIDEDKIVLRKWWKQFAHTTSHFVRVIPFMRFIQGSHRTHFCGAYTLFNTHEVAVISGLAIADRLGAPYPFSHDALALKQFKLYRDTLLPK